VRHAGWPLAMPSRRLSALCSGPATEAGACGFSGHGTRFRQPVQVPVLPPAPLVQPRHVQHVGPSPLPQGHAAPWQACGQSPRRALCPRRAGHCPAAGAGGTGLCRSVARRRGNAGRASRPRPKGQSRSPDREASPGRLAVGLLFQHPVRDNSEPFHHMRSGQGHHPWGPRNACHRCSGAKAPGQRRVRRWPSLRLSERSSWDRGP